MDANHRPEKPNVPDIEDVLNVSPDWLYRLVTSTEPPAVEQLITRLFREYLLEHPEKAQELLHRLESLTADPALRSLAYAPEDDEPLTDEDLAAIEAATLEAGQRQGDAARRDALEEMTREAYEAGEYEVRVVSMMRYSDGLSKSGRPSNLSGGSIIRS